MGHVLDIYFGRVDMGMITVVPILGQLIRDMEGSIIELRRETVRAVAREKQLQKQIAASKELVEDLEEKAKLALVKGEEDLAREVLAKKIHTVR